MSGFQSISDWLNRVANTDPPKVELATSEEHVGTPGGITVTPSFTPVLTVAGAYSANDYVGTSANTTAITAARINAGAGWVISARLIDYALQSIRLSVGYSMRPLLRLTTMPRGHYRMPIC